MERRKSRCCAICDKELYDVKEHFVAPHLLAGEPRFINKPLPDAMRVSYVLVSGKTCMITLCRECSGGKIDLAEMWRRCMRRAVWEHNNRRAMGVEPLRPEVLPQVDQMLMDQVADVPLGIINIESQVDYDKYR